MAVPLLFHSCIRKLNNITKYAIKEAYYIAMEENPMSKRMTKRVLSFLLVAIMIAVLLPLSHVNEVVQAASPWRKTIAGMGTSGIKAPQKPTSEMDPWRGSYVWYGHYPSTDPVSYRVLTPKTSLYGGNTMLMHSDRPLFEARFDKDGVSNEGATKVNEWKYSDLRASLNGDAFLNKGGVFTTIEKSAIAKSTIAAHPLVQGSGAFQVPSDEKEDFINYVALTGEKIFLLDVEDFFNSSYGYYNYDGHVMDLHFLEDCWTRSAISKYSYTTGVGVIDVEGQVESEKATDWNFVMPAFNIDLSKILFSSLIKDADDSEFGGDEYKLTLVDENMQVGITPGFEITTYVNEGGDRLILVPYTITGSNASNATQMSALILDKEYLPGNTNNANVLLYEKLSCLSDTFSTSDIGSFSSPAGEGMDLDLEDWGTEYHVYVFAEDLNDIHETDYAGVPMELHRPDGKASVYSATAKYNSIAKTGVQEFEVRTSEDVQYLMLYSENSQTLVKTWKASENSTIKNGRRVWTVSQAINTAGDRKLVFKGGTTNATPVTNAMTVSFKVESTGVLSASAKNAVIKKGGEQVFTVKTTSDAKYLVEYAEDGKTKVKTWTADSSNSTVSGNVRTWTVKQNIATAGNRKLIFKAGTSTTPTSAQKTAAFTVEEVWVNSVSVKYATIGKGGNQTFTVKTTSNAQNLMLYGEGGNLVKTWAASGNSTVSGDVRTWTVTLAIGTAGNRELTIKAGKTTTPSSFGKTVKFAVVEKKLVSASAKYAAITKTSMQGFTVKTSAEMKYLMLYSEDGKTLVKSWAASGNSTVGADNIRTWYVMQPINTAGNRKLVFKGGTTNTTAVTNALTVSFKVESTGVLTVSAMIPEMMRGLTQTFTVTTTSDCKYLAEYAENGNLVTSWTANSSNSKVSGNVRTWTLSQTINTVGKRTLTFKAGVSSPTSAVRNVDFTVYSDLPIVAAYFPDEAFRQCIKNSYDTTKDGKLSKDEVLAVKWMTVSGTGIKTLKGVEFFTALKQLDCWNNQLTTLDVSKNTALELLKLDCNQLTTLDVSKNTALKTLQCSSNKLTTLDVSKNTALEYLYCSGNQLTALDMSKNTALKYLFCDNNQLTAIGLSKNTALQKLYCYGNKLTTLDVSKCTALETLECQRNQLTALNLSNNKELLRSRLECDDEVVVTWWN